MRYTFGFLCYKAEFSFQERTYSLIQKNQLSKLINVLPVLNIFEFTRYMFYEEDVLVGTTKARSNAHELFYQNRVIKLEYKKRSLTVRDENDTIIGTIIKKPKVEMEVSIYEVQCERMSIELLLAFFLSVCTVFRGGNFLAFTRYELW
ncbi:hypothetical protein [Ructibacterium gallinarum]|uniref:Uncharacterized protein n=1 Tax=Ructibacterium gallinarum TaxID=2779355 RepID=A0A9D5M385_9FIRM|nr:hypothetical protein [Ructibacterium gallinarum]MBE5041301.1 hypothetical protein [Ructibacterium gallinarum]